MSRNAERIRFIVLAAQREGQRLFAEALDPLGVTPTQAEAIAVLRERAPLTLKQLGALLIAETGSPSRLVTGLVAAGLVTREPLPDDRRAVMLSLSASGREVAARIAAAEATLYEAIERAADAHDVDAALGLLIEFVGERVTGAALRRRGLL